MDIFEAMECRHAVRRYIDKPIENEKVDCLNALIDECNKEGNLNLKLCVNEREGFSGYMARYGSFSGVKNYIIVQGKQDDTFSERAGYYAQKVVLQAQILGLNSCWAALTYNKSIVKREKQVGNKVIAVIALGYGEYDGIKHTSKSVFEVSDAQNPPEWYEKGLKYALLAPTALNQQKFKFRLYDNNAVECLAQVGFYTKLDSGIVKCQFELGAGKENFIWKK